MADVYDPTQAQAVQTPPPTTGGGGFLSGLGDFLSNLGSAGLTGLEGLRHVIAQSGIPPLSSWAAIPDVINMKLALANEKLTALHAANITDPAVISAVMAGGFSPGSGWSRPPPFAIHPAAGGGVPPDLTNYLASQYLPGTAPKDYLEGYHPAYLPDTAPPPFMSPTLATSYAHQGSALANQALGMSQGFNWPLRIPGTNLVLKELVPDARGFQHPHYGVEERQPGQGVAPFPEHGAGPGPNAPQSRANPNNPGGIMDGDFARAQPGYVGTGPTTSAGTLAAFDTPEHGAAAHAALLHSSQYQGMTVGAALQRWSGPNTPSNYASDITQRAGIDPNRQMASLTPDEMARLQAAQAQQENVGGGRGLARHPAQPRALPGAGGVAPYPTTPPATPPAIPPTPPAAAPGAAFAAPPPPSTAPGATGGPPTPPAVKPPSKAAMDAARKRLNDRFGHGATAPQVGQPGNPPGAPQMGPGETVGGVVGRALAGQPAGTAPGAETPATPSLIERAGGLLGGSEAAAQEAPPDQGAAAKTAKEPGTTFGQIADLSVADPEFRADLIRRYNLARKPGDPPITDVNQIPPDVLTADQYAVGRARQYARDLKDEEMFRRGQMTQAARAQADRERAKDMANTVMLHYSQVLGYLPDPKTGQMQAVTALDASSPSYLWSKLAPQHQAAGGGYIHQKLEQLGPSGSISPYGADYLKNNDRGPAGLAAARMLAVDSLAISIARAFGTSGRINQTELNIIMNKILPNANNTYTGNVNALASLRGNLDALAKGASVQSLRMQVGLPPLNAQGEAEY